MGMIELTVNGQAKAVSQGSSIADLMRELEVRIPTVVVEYNGAIIQRETMDQMVLASGDRLEVVRFVAGG